MFDSPPAVVLDSLIAGGKPAGARLAMALFVPSDLGQADPAALAIIARVFSIPSATSAELEIT